MVSNSLALFRVGKAPGAVGLSLCLFRMDKAQRLLPRTHRGINIADLSLSSDRLHRGLREESGLEILNSGTFEDSALFCPRRGSWQNTVTLLRVAS